MAIQDTKKFLGTIKNGGGVYAIINLMNSKKYIGSSSNVRKRLKSHYYSLTKGNHFSFHLQRAWNKYGKDNFCCEILKNVPDKNNLESQEQIFLDEYQVYNRKFGYNTSNKSHVCIHTEHSKNLLRKANTGKRYSNEINKKKGSPGELNYFYKNPHSREMIKQIREVKGIKNKLFICIETGQIFEFYSDASKLLKTRMASISECLHKKRYNTNNLHFIFIEEIPFSHKIRNNFILLSVEEKKQLLFMVDRKRKFFRCNETREIFSSVNAAGRHFNICRVYITRCLLQEIKIPKAFTFSYV